MEPGFLRDNARWLGAGALLTFASSFGQTFFIALFGGELRAAFDLTHGEWGALYTGATVASAALLMAAGGLADRFRVRALALGVLALYAALCLGMSLVSGPLTLGLLVFGLRFCGQGMMSQLAMTAMGRWFRARRGRAVAVAGLGFSLGEASLPAAAVALSAAAGWRGAWVAAAAFLALTAPLLLWLLRRERTPQRLAQETSQAGMGGRHWTRAEALRHWSFWALTPGLLAPPFIGTALFFQQVRLAEVKGWSLASVAAGYPAYSAVTVACAFLAGWLVDRYGARRLLPAYQAPMAAGALMLSAGDGVWTLWAAFALFGATQGGAVAILGALWPEIYGVRWLGGIRALAVASMVFATALGPGVTGALIDAGVTVERQFQAMAAVSLIVCLGFTLVSARLRAEIPSASSRPA